MTDLSSVFTQAMNRPGIVCDIDGILADWVSAACEAVNGHFGTAYTPMVWWNWAGPFDDEQRGWITEQRHNDPAFWMSLSANGEAITALHDLAVGGYRITVSSEAPALGPVRAARSVWIEYHQVPYNELYLVGAGGKVALCSQSSVANPIVLIDDNPQRWVDCASYPGVQILCPRTSYSPAMASESNVTLFERFSEIPGLVAGLSVAA